MVIGREVSSRMGILATNPAVYARVANKADKSGQSTGMEVQTQRSTASARKRIKRSARLCGGEHGGRIARGYQLLSILQRMVEIEG